MLRPIGHHNLNRNYIKNTYAQNPTIYSISEIHGKDICVFNDNEMDIADAEYNILKYDAVI